MTGPFGALRQFLQGPRAAAGEQCELCATPMTGDHAHVVNVETRRLLCACRPCYLLFTHSGAAQGKYRAVPDRRVHHPSFKLTDADWERLQIPVRMAFFFFNSSLGRTVAFYPGPAGATESLLPLEAWGDLVEDNAPLAQLAPDVEALLVHGGRGRQGFDCFIVPIHVCYQLVGQVRLHWKGFSGGEEAWRAIDEFFSALRAKSEVAKGSLQ
jgi:uncharacterized protein DUF5947